MFEKFVETTRFTGNVQEVKSEDASEARVWGPCEIGIESWQ